uniref:G_PROTEIN_RECEP_F1_2 domain-containing protein n=1 Tax=Ascaris lumbricoides TaxID=6252 RepID=A0A0M3IDW7_ASCLU
MSFNSSLLQVSGKLLAEQLSGKHRAYFFFTTFGSIAVISNITVVLVYVSSSVLRCTYRVVTALAIADLINGLSFVLNGVYKIVEFGMMTYIPEISMHDCALKPWPALRLIGGQWAALLTFCLGSERILAVRYPFAYVAFHEKRQATCIMITALLVGVSLMIAYIFPTLIKPDRPTDFQCSLSLAFGLPYSIFNYAITITADMIGFSFSVAAYYMAKVSAKKSGIRMPLRKELARTRLIFLLSLLSVVLVAVPNAIILKAITGKSYSDAVFDYVYCIFCIRSCLNILIFGVYNVDFRSQLLKVVSHLLSITSGFIKNCFISLYTLGFE